MRLKKLREGDRVIVKKYGSPGGRHHPGGICMIGLEGIVINIDPRLCPSGVVLVDFGPAFKGHKGGGQLPTETGWFIFGSDLRRLSNKKKPKKED